MLRYKNYSKFNLYEHKNIIQCVDIYKIGVTAGLISICEVAALFSPTQIIVKGRQRL